MCHSAMWNSAQHVERKRYHAIVITRMKTRMSEIPMPPHH